MGNFFLLETLQFTVVVGDDRKKTKATTFTIVHFNEKKDYFFVGYLGFFVIVATTFHRQFV